MSHTVIQVAWQFLFYYYLFFVDKVLLMVFILTLGISAIGYVWRYQWINQCIWPHLANLLIFRYAAIYNKFISGETGLIYSGLSTKELERKKYAIFKHQSQKDRAVSPGDDSREFWQRAEDRNRETAKAYDELGLAEYEAMKAFVHWKFQD